MKAITVEPKNPETARLEDIPEPELRNNVMVGSVNANKRHWHKAGEVLARADRSWLARLVTRRERPQDFMKALERTADDTKVVLQFAEVRSGRVDHMVGPTVKSARESNLEGRPSGRSPRPEQDAAL